MLTLTIQQPWASLIIHNIKRLETRSWNTKHRGPIAIHAARSITTYGYKIFQKFKHLLNVANITDLPMSALIGTASLNKTYQVTPTDDLKWVPETELALGDFNIGRWIWRLNDALPFHHPIPCPGNIGLWNQFLFTEEHDLFFRIAHSDAEWHDHPASQQTFFRDTNTHQEMCEHKPRL